MANARQGDDRSVLAAEYVLGLLEGAELERARALATDDADFARLADEWTRHFELLFAQWPARQPPPELERRIQALGGVAANDNQLARWKWATGTFGALAAALALLLVVPTRETVIAPPPEPAIPSARPIAIAFSMDEGARTLPAMVDPASHQLRVPAGLDVPQGRVAQLWLIEGEKAPLPIGLFTPTKDGLAATMTLDRDLPAGAVLAISIEPPGGSPTGQPTGPVVATGHINPV